MKKKITLHKTAVAVMVSGLFAGAALAQEETNPGYSPFVDKDYPRTVYFGDTHMHSAFSADAGMLGLTMSAEDTFRFARGEEVKTSSGMRAKIDRPLDFMVLADHSENLGLAPMLLEGNEMLLENETGKRWLELYQAGLGRQVYFEWASRSAWGGDQINDPEVNRVSWHRLLEVNERFNEPGIFTALHGYEWSSLNGQDAPSNLHRVVIFRDGIDVAKQTMPMSAFKSHDPERLWDWMEDAEKNAGATLLAIPHNGNLSNGLMFPNTRWNGEPIDESYVETRARWEPLYEVTQIKGDGEAHPVLSPDDEFADFGTWDRSDIMGWKAKTDDMLPGEYAREALKTGLKHEEELGTNPYQFGVIGATDSHSSFASTRADNYFGKMAEGEPSAHRINGFVVKSAVGDDALSSRSYEEMIGGLAAVWATENTREALFDAMQRKEVYATTGNRMSVRVFGGWEFEESDIYSPYFVDLGYSKGVPMGGDLVDAPKNAVPRFMIQAQRDAMGANLERVQVVKGWLDSDGETQERIYDVIVSDGRTIGEDGRAREAVASTVDLKDASYNNSVGQPIMEGFWQDPDFDPNLRAFYYVRVLEIPTPNWMAYDAKYFGNEIPAEAVMEIQNRAYTSAIWYTPAK
ncbi:DUF3604 domain-containing protein [Ferrimonas pelagia]|uniref:DUF3604 domain-containing protein n=1 Tax=Ferrimonas pelagia TaxID=1177826 RepID=A0ABP9F511_9GAMM